MTTIDPTPASMGGPLSEAEQLRAENAKLLRKLELANKHRQHSIESLHKLESKLIGWREAAEKAAAERDAATARVGVLEGQLATAREALADNVAEYDREIASFTLPTTMSREDEEGRDITRAEAKKARRCLEAFDDAVAAPRMPRPPAEEGCTCHLTDPSTWTTYGSAVEPGSMYEPDPDCPEHGAHTEILTAQEAHSGPETPGTGSGRGMGVAEASRTAQVVDDA